MPLRQVQVHLPVASAADFDAYLAERDTEVLWRGTDDAAWGFAALVVVDAFEADALVHGLMEKFGHLEHFRLVLSEVVATYPRPDEKEEEKPDEEEPDDDAPARPAGRVAIEELEERLAGDARPDGTFAVTVFLSALVAALGLMRDNTAVVIGAMVIAPLLGPNMALALGTTLGKLDLIRKSLVTNAAGVAMAFLFAVCLGAVTNPDPSGPEIASRTTVEFSDILLALASGVAGAVAVTTGVPTALVGVMVAVALMPPLVTSGLLLGSGEFTAGAMAALLTAINVIAVNLAAVGTFVAKGIRPRRYWEADSAARMTRVAITAWLVLLAALAALLWVAKHSPPA
jgi:uncharacterized hydrophobic protein (TIGR00341 family)